MNLMLKIFTGLLLASIHAHAFVPASRTFRLAPVVGAPQHVAELPTPLQRQRKSVGQIQMMGLFGLGVPEIGVILVAAAFLLGPQKLAELGKDAGKIAGELKEVPKEFQKGMQEGEEKAKEIKAEMLGSGEKSEEKAEEKKK